MPALDTGKTAENWLVAFGVPLKTVSFHPGEQTCPERWFQRNNRGPAQVTVPGPNIVSDPLPAGTGVRQDILIVEADHVNTLPIKDGLLDHVPLAGITGTMKETINLDSQEMPREEKIYLPSTQHHTLPIV